MPLGPMGRCPVRDQGDFQPELLAKVAGVELFGDPACIPVDGKAVTLLQARSKAARPIGLRGLAPG